MSPITIVCLPALVNAAHAVRPSGGVIRTPAAVTLMSLRGSDTLKTPSFSSSVPLAPVSSSMPAVSKGAAGLSAAAALAASRVVAKMPVAEHRPGGYRQAASRAREQCRAVDGADPTPGR